MNFGEKIRAAREAHRLSMQGLAMQLNERLGQKGYPAFIDRVEKGLAFPNETVTKALASILEIDVDELLALVTWDLHEADAAGSPARRFGTMIKSLRTARSLTLRDVAERVSADPSGVNLNYTSLSGVERGDYIPSIKVIRALARVFGVDEEELLELSGKFDSRSLQKRAEADPRVATILHVLSMREDLTEAQIQAMVFVLEPGERGSTVSRLLSALSAAELSDAQLQAITRILEERSGQ